MCWRRFSCRARDSRPDNTRSPGMKDNKSEEEDVREELGCTRKSSCTSAEFLSLKAAALLLGKLAVSEVFERLYFPVWPNWGLH